MIDGLFDAGDPSHVRKAKRTAERVAEETSLTVRSLLATPAQRAFWWNIISACGVFHSAILPEGEMYFAAGQRNVGLMLLAAIPTDLRKIMEDEATANLKEKLNA